MENLTLGQVAAGLAFIVALFGSIKYLANLMSSAMKENIKDELAPVRSDLEEIRKTMGDLKDDNLMLKKTTYTMLSHMATNNNTKEMNALLKEFTEYAMHMKD